MPIGLHISQNPSKRVKIDEEKNHFSALNPVFPGLQKFAITDDLSHLPHVTRATHSGKTDPIR